MVDSAPVPRRQAGGASIYGSPSSRSSSSCCQTRWRTDRTALAATSSFASSNRTCATSSSRNSASPTRWAWRRATVKERARWWSGGSATARRLCSRIPMVSSPTRENNFRFGAQDESDTLRCPFHAHIRKTNPRGDIARQFGAPDAAERDHRIARRGITYGERNRHPNAFQALDDLPSKDVGLLFMCFQASIRDQFAFMQRGWANNQGFVKLDPEGAPITGID